MYYEITTVHYGVTNKLLPYFYGVTTIFSATTVVILYYYSITTVALP